MSRVQDLPAFVIQFADSAAGRRAVLKCAYPMFHPLSLFLGLRYAGARSHKFFVSFITWV